jgi:protoporphyrin/coproporphyrin ferrochelatase
MTTGVLLMAHGTPASTAEIAPFYTRIRRGRPPTPEQLAELEGRYATIGGVSPLAIRTAAQVDAVRAALDVRAPGHYRVVFGAKHTDPLIEESAAALGAAGVDRVIGLVLTPHGSSMGSEEYMERAVAALGPTTFVAVAPWYGEPGLVSLLADRVHHALRTVDASDSGSGSGRATVIFTAHSLPARIVESGDTYPEQLAESARLVAEAAGLDGSSWSVAWQSAGRTPEPWLGPDVRDVVRELGTDESVDAVVVCPIGFVADHLEVLYDLDVEVARIAEEVGLTFARTASLNDDPAFIVTLTDLIVDADGAG